MKSSIVIFALLFAVLQLKAQLVTGPFEFNTSFTGEFADNFKGGFKQGDAYYGLEQLSLNFNTETAGFWNGGNFFIHLLNIHGTGATAKYVGDMMVLSNIEASDFTGLFEIWYAQNIGKFMFLFGQHDMNTEFAGTKYGENFLNSTYGVVSNIALNIPISVYPIAAPCLLTKYYFSDNLILKIASYDGNPGTIESNKHNMKWHLSSSEGFMNIAELQYTVINHNQNGITTSNGIQMGSYKLGMFYHTGPFSNYYDSTKTLKGNYGIYFIADQMIIPKPSKPSEGLALMMEVGFSPPKLNLISYSIEGGIRYHGILPWRTKDFIGIAFTYARLSKYVLSNDVSRSFSESSIEASYKFQFANHYTIQPDFQYIIHPGALKTVPNACVGLLRFQLAL